MLLFGQGVEVAAALGPRLAWPPRWQACANVTSVLSKSNGKLSSRSDSEIIS